MHLEGRMKEGAGMGKGEADTRPHAGSLRVAQAAPGSPSARAGLPHGAPGALAGGDNRVLFSSCELCLVCRETASSFLCIHVLMKPAVTFHLRNPLSVIRDTSTTHLLLTFLPPLPRRTASSTWEDI